jgi:hypothetical protein
MLYLSSLIYKCIYSLLVVAVGPFDVSLGVVVVVGAVVVSGHSGLQNVKAHGFQHFE